MASWKLLLVPMVGCHFFSSSRKSGPWAERRAVILEMWRTGGLEDEHSWSGGPGLEVQSGGLVEEPRTGGLENLRIT